FDQCVDDALDARMVGGDSVPDQSEGRGQAFEQVDAQVEVVFGLGQQVGGVDAGGSGTDDGPSARRCGHVSPRSVVGVLRGQARDEGVVFVDDSVGGGPARGADVVEEVDVGRVVVLPFLGHIVFEEDRLDGADGFARTAVDAFVGVDVERALTLVDAVDRAFFDAGAVLHVHTGLGDDVGHGFLVSSLCSSVAAVKAPSA